MHITVSGKNMDVGAALRSHAESRLGHEVEKYLDRVTDANIVFSKESHFIRTDINLNTGTHSRIIIKSKGEAGDAYVSFNDAADKIEKQLRRYKRRIKNHHKPKMEATEEKILLARKYVLQPEEEAHEEKEQPLIIAEKNTDIETLNVSDAVMKMDLADLPALVFINKKSKRINVVYKRVDGNISWVDPEVN